MMYLSALYITSDAASNLVPTSHCGTRHAVALYAQTAGAIGIGAADFVIMGLLLKASADLHVSIAAASLVNSGYAGADRRWPCKTVLLARWRSSSPAAPPVRCPPII